MSKGHNHSVDYWSFGVLVYEMLVGHSPFSKPNQSQMDMFKRIVMVQYECPPLVSSVGKDLIRQLLVRPVQERIGTRSRGHLDIMDHDWFKESCVSFQKLLKREMIAPWTPKVKDPFDASNFDNFASAESEVDIGRPLTTIEQDIFKEF